MKYFIVLLFLSFTANSSIHTESTTVFDSIQENYLEGIQYKIINAYRAEIKGMEDNNQMTSILTNLEKHSNGSAKGLVQYWRAYALYYQSIVYLSKGNKDKASMSINAAISSIEEKENKNSEDYAMLALAQSFSIQFNSFKAPMLSRQVTNNAKRSIEMDENNPRAYYVLASSSYYKPKIWGGGKDVLPNAKKAISLPSQTIKNPYNPSWGIEESYILLIKHLSKEGDYEKARMFYEMGLNTFPNNHAIKRYAKLLKKE